MTMDRGPRTGVTGAVSLSALDFIEGVGLRMAGLASLIDGLLDWLADLMMDDIVSTEMKVFQGSDDYVYCKIHFSSFVVLVCQ